MKTAALFIFGLLACNLALADAEAGKAVFTKLCSGCHKIGPSARNAFGPPLTGIVGKHAGEQPGYVYTSGMKESGIVWTRDKISELVEDPSGVVPGTRMKLWWMGSDQRMKDLLDYLEASQADAAE